LQREGRNVNSLSQGISNRFLLTNPHLVIFLSFASCFWSKSGSVQAASVDYQRDIKPIFAKHCFSCHSALRQESGLRLDAVQLIRVGGDRGPAIVPKISDESILLQAVQGDGDVDRMPPEGQALPLSKQQIALLKDWIDQGADAPDELIPPDPRGHWAYQLPTKAQVPDIRPSLLQRNQIDAFLAATRKRYGLVAVDPASKETLLRRVYFDLVGLPPTREELQAFLNDTSDNAYESVVDQLLSSPRYGERWGRHWMDVWRYTDWSGLDNKMRHSQRHIWRWRDWIIESLNQDKGYDRMVMEMLAGDELDPANPKVVRATGFLARNWYLYNRNFWLDDIIEHTSKGFLGITLNCARCHEHKYDPISHEDYYRFRAFFEPHNVRLDQVGTERDLNKDGLPRVYDAHPLAKTYRFIRGDEKRPDTTQAHRPDIPAVLGSIEGTIRPVRLPVEAYFPALRSRIRHSAIAAFEAILERSKQEVTKKSENYAAAKKQLVILSRQEAAKATGQPKTCDAKELVAACEVSVETSQRELDLALAKYAVAQAELDAYRASLSADLVKFSDGVESPEKFMGLAQEASRAHRKMDIQRAELQLLLAKNSLFLARNSRNSEDEGTRKVVEDAEENLHRKREKLKSLMSESDQQSIEYEHIGEVYPARSTGRRLALACWIADEKNPLTARVAVNHIWTRHFGAPLVESMFDFGLRSKRPVNWQLLDWLSIEFMEHSWSMKHLHRLIVTSNAFRMESVPSGTDQRNQQIDPDNHLIWRMNAGRMEAEVVRDTLIYLAGRLDFKMGGADLPITTSDVGTRRTIYYRYSRDHQLKFLRMFDSASVEECYRRKNSIVPQQALAMSNSKLVLSSGRQLAATISAEVGSEYSEEKTNAFVQSAFQHVLGRDATPTECVACLSALKEFAAVIEGQGMSATDIQQRARENLIRVLLNHNDFITIR